MKTKMVCFAMILAMVFAWSGCGFKQAVPEKSLSPAGKVVQSFFKNWKFERYSQMQEQTVNSRDKDVFIEAMKTTPIQWRNFSILAEEQSGDDWDVTISLEVTDVKSTLAALLVNLEFPPPEDSQSSGFYMSPRFLGIEEFMPIKQTWRVINLDGNFVIDVCSGESDGERYDNIMNYIIDAGQVTTLPSLNDEESESDRIATAASFWMALVCMDLDITSEKMLPILKDAMPISEKAKAKLVKLARELDALSNDETTSSE